MALEFGNPYMLLLFPAALILIFLIDRKTGKTLRARVTRIARIITTALLVAALAAPQITAITRQESAWALLDVSDSAAPQQTQMIDSLKEKLSNLSNGKKAGVIAFGRDAMVETALSDKPVFTSVHTDVDSGGTDVAAALALARTLAGDATSARAVLLSDGRFTLTDMQIAELAARGMIVDGVRFSSDTGTDAQVSAVSIPSSVYLGQSFDVTVTLTAAEPIQGTLVLYQGGTPSGTRQVTLRKGENTFVFSDVARETGTVAYSARFQSAADKQAANNTLGAYTRVIGAPSVLLVTQNAQSELQKLLTAAGMNVTAVTPSAMPVTAEALRAYDAIALDNVDFDAARAECWTALGTAVRSLGVGLAVFGGNSSYALGSYRGSALEKMLPVTIDVKNKLQSPALSLILAIDKSGSMTEAQFGQTRLDLAKEAAMRATEVLNANDNVGVIAFDDAAKWVVPLQSATDVASIQSMIGTIRPGGGTAFYSPLYEALEALKSANTPQKHVIFLSDGDPADGTFGTLAAEMAKNGITLTCVAVGEGANTELLSSLATLGGGRFYAPTQFDDLPKIFTKETYLAGGSYIKNHQFTPVVTISGALTNYDGFPSLSGYLATTAKDLSETYLETDEEDPLLSSWRYGAGRVAAWTSDVSGAWTQQFLAWNESSAFFSGIVSSVLAEETSAGALESTLSNGALSLTYRRSDETEANGDVHVTVVRPSGKSETVTLKKTAAGVYQGTLAATEEGAYTLRAVDSLSGAERTTLGGAVVPYASEYDLRLNSDNGSFDRLVSLTGGTMFDPNGDYLNFSGGSQRSRRSLTPLMTLLTLLFLLLDIALRRLPWDWALEKAIAAHKTKSEKASKPTPAVKPAETIRQGDAPSEKNKQTRSEQAAQSTDQLLQSLRDKKKL